MDRQTLINFPLRSGTSSSSRSSNSRSFYSSTSKASPSKASAPPPPAPAAAKPPAAKPPSPAAAKTYPKPATGGSSPNSKLLSKTEASKAKEVQEIRSKFSSAELRRIDSLASARLDGKALDHSNALKTQRRAQASQVKERHFKMSQISIKTKTTTRAAKGGRSPSLDKAWVVQGQEGFEARFGRRDDRILCHREKRFEEHDLLTLQLHLPQVVLSFLHQREWL